MNNGFRHNPLSDIQDLRNLLGDQYDFHSILKELVQNADDSGSKELHLALAPGWPDAVHPLLRGPALVVANDGEFRPADAEGIRSLRLGSKGGDAGTIGKFGLGMKSVFHLCEAFFYFRISRPACITRRRTISWIPQPVVGQPASPRLG